MSGILGNSLVSADWHDARDIIQRLAKPIFQAAREDGISKAMPVETAPNSRRNLRAFAGLEAVGRFLCGAAPALELGYEQRGSYEILPIVEVHHLIDVSTDPDSPHRLNFTRGGPQPLVDAAFLAQAILRAPNALWGSLTPQVRNNLREALVSTRTISPYFNNWLLFSATIEAALFQIGCSWDRVRVDYALRQLEQWYVGDGFYSDGPKFRWDYYNSYVIQPMLFDILRTVGKEYEPWADMYLSLRPRMSRYAEVLERMIGPDGSFPPIGRSLSYRCAAFQPLAQLSLHQVLPGSLPPGQVRAGLMAVIRRSLSDERNYDSNGWLKIGLNGSQPTLGERYISTGSLYLCSTAFLPLGLSSDSPFWSDAQESWTQKRLWSEGSAVQADKALEG